MKFADGTTLSDIDIDAAGRIYFHGTSNNDMLLGGDNSADWFSGGAGNDYFDLGGTDGSDFQYAVGGAGDDVYHITRQNGAIALGYEAAGGGQDRVVFADATIGDLNIYRHSAEYSDSLIIKDGLGLNVHVHGADAANNAIEAFEFSDGAVINVFKFGDANGNTLNGGTGNDYLSGVAGNNTISGGAGDDYLVGGVDLDWLTGGDGADTIDGGGGHGHAFYHGSNAGVQINLAIGTATGGHATGDTLLNIQHLDGSSHEDELIGDSGGNYIHAQAGEDLVHGSSGNDHLLGGIGNDVVYGGSGDDLLYGNEGDDHVYGHEGNDTLYGNGGDDNLEGGAGADHYDGGTGVDWARYFYASGSVSADLQNGGTGSEATGDTYVNIENLLGSEIDNDFLNGDASNNTIHGVGGDDYIHGQGGIDVVYGGSGNDTVLGGLGDDHVFGHEGHDTLFGNEDNDHLTGGVGNDQLDGGLGNDWLIGNADDDVFIFKDNYGHDTIADFGNGNDVVDLRSVTPVNSYTDLLALTRQENSDTIIEFNNDNSLTLENFQLANLQQDDFWFA